MSKNYKDSLLVEQKSKKIILDFLTNLDTNPVWLEGKNEQQKGDIFLKDLDLYIEVKAEQKKISPYFFIETWSNKSRKTFGWLYTIKADYLFYLFLKEMCLYCITVSDLKKVKTYSYCYTEVEQKKYTQLNDTWGLLVPRKHIDAVKIKLC